MLCFSDSLAADVLRAAADLGVRVPTELSVVGFDDSSLALRLSPPLTTVTQDVVAKGTLAATELITAVRRRRAGEPERARHHLLPTELVCARHHRARREGRRGSARGAADPRHRIRCRTGPGS